MYYSKLDEKVEISAPLGRQTTCFAGKFGTLQLLLRFKGKMTNSPKKAK
jgi:hypothetical protein